MMVPSARKVNQYQSFLYKRDTMKRTNIPGRIKRLQRKGYRGLYGSHVKIQSDQLSEKVVTKPRVDSDGVQHYNVQSPRNTCMLIAK